MMEEGAMIPLLDVPIRHVMTSGPATIDPEATLGEAAGRMLEGGFRHLPVLDAGGSILGMLSERDLRARLGVELERFPDAATGLLDEQVERAMRPDPLTVGDDAHLREVLEILGNERVGAVLVVDDAERLVGIVSYVDVLQFLRDQDSAVSIRPARTSPAPTSPPRPPARGTPGSASRPRGSAGPRSRSAR
jgi:CBS domain-containing protein